MGTDVLSEALPSLRQRALSVREAAPNLVEAKIAALLGVTSLALFAFAARLRFVGHVISGDEPHYLIISRTLKTYHSLDVMRTYNSRAYWQFYPAIIKPHVAQGAHSLLPLHNIGGPLLWHIPFLLWGYGGV